MPADIRQSHERALSTWRLQVSERSRARARAKMVGKYHMVRFFGAFCFSPFLTPPLSSLLPRRLGRFTSLTARGCQATERQKATRRLKRLEKQLRDSQQPPPPNNNETDEREREREREKLRESLRIARVDLNYAMYFPLGEKYLSLYPRDGGGGGDGGGGEKSWLPVWRVVERCLRDEEDAQAALEALREGTGPAWFVEGRGARQEEEKDDVGAVERTRGGKGRPKVDREKARRQDGHELRMRTERKGQARNAREDRDDDGSDGGFFEE